MPRTVDAIRQLQSAYRRLVDLGWEDASHFRKNGASGYLIEANQLRIVPGLIQKGRYRGDWPHGRYWIEYGDTRLESHPALFRPTQKLVGK